MDGQTAHQKRDGAGAAAASLSVVREPAENHGAGTPAEAPAKTKGRVAKRAIPLLLGLGVLAYAGDAGYQWFQHDRFFETTDNAYVTAEITQVAVKVSGYVRELAVEANQSVKAGDLIARIDDGDYRLAERSAREKAASQRSTIDRIARQAIAAQAGVLQAEAQAQSARATLTRATADFERQSSLSAQRFASASALDAARAARDTAEAAVHAAEAALAQARANVDVVTAQAAEARGVLAELETALAKAERDLTFTEIRAPVGGTVGARAVEAGAYVQPGARLTALVADDSLRIDANFKETQLAAVRPGAPVEITVDAYPDRMLRGRVVSVSPATGAMFSLLPPENATGNFTKIVQRVPVRVAVEDPQGILRTGLSVKVAVDTRGAS